MALDFGLSEICLMCLIKTIKPNTQLRYGDEQERLDQKLIWAIMQPVKADTEPMSLYKT